MGVIDEITAERRRQIDVEGWTADHDDGHAYGAMSRAAACYAAHASARCRVNVDLAAYQQGAPLRSIGWPWLDRWWKPKDPRRDLIRAAALIVAEIERIDRLADKGR
jgi:hypothetical protein